MKYDQRSVESVGHANRASFASELNDMEKREFLVVIAILGFAGWVNRKLKGLSRSLVPSVCALLCLMVLPLMGSEVVPVTEREKIEASLDKEITVEGRIERIGESKTRSILFLNFEGLERGGFTLIIRQGTLAGDYVQHDPAFGPSFVGKNLRVTGTVTTYQGGFQMQVFAPSQIEVLPDKVPAS